MTGILAVVGVVVAISLLQRVRLERWLSKTRSQYLSTRPHLRASQHVERLAELALRTLGNGILNHPEVDSITLDGVDDTARLHSAVDFCARRFGLTSQQLIVSFAHLPADTAADMASDVTPLATVGPNGIELTLTEANRFRIRVDNTARGDDDVLTANVAHELAHVALKQHGIWLDNKSDNELLTEAAAILAGFGPLMRSTAFFERRHFLLGGPQEVTSGTRGYLHEESIDRLMAFRAAKRGATSGRRRGAT